MIIAMIAVLWVVVRYRRGCNSYFGLYYRFRGFQYLRRGLFYGYSGTSRKSERNFRFDDYGVAGGAIAPPLMGICADAVGGQGGSVIIIAICTAYLLFCSYGIKVAKK